MLAKLKQLVSNIEASETPSADLVPQELLEVLISGNKAEVGKFLLDAQRENYDFSFEKENVREADKLWELARTSETDAQKVYYALAFVGSYNKVTAKNVRKILTENLNA